MKVLFTLCFAFLPAFVSLAQTPGTVSGRLLDEKQQPLPFATVLLRPVQDTTQTTATQSAADGSYRFGNVAAGRYHVTINALGYLTRRSAPFEVGSAGVLLPPLQLAVGARQLRGVEVVGRKPLLEMQGGKMIVNVEGSLTAGATALEVLQQVPGLLVMNDRISIAGRQGVVVLIDGRTTRYTDVMSVLKDFPSSSIARIEVMAQPDASYDAAGNTGILNIILKKNVDLGTNGTLSANVGYGRFAKAGSNLDLNHRAGKLNVFGNYGLARRKTYEQLNTERNPDEPGARYVQRSYQPRTATVNTLRLGADYNLTPRQTLGVLVNGYTNRTLAQAENGVTAPGNIEVATQNRSQRRTNSYAANLNYRLQLDTLGRELTADADYSYYESGSFGQVQNAFSNGAGERLRNDQNVGIGLRSGRVDYRWPLRPTLKLRLGAKTSQADIRTTLDLVGGTNDRQESFRFVESIQAGYVQAEGEQLGFSWQAGLRGEWTDNRGHNTKSSSSDTRFTRHYGQLFPSLNVDRVLHKSVGMNAAYSRRIDRPSYQDLNPNIIYLDPYTQQRGNENLMPQFTSNYKLALTYNKQPFVILSHSRTDDVISLVTETEGQLIYSISRNLSHQNSYSAALNVPLSFVKQLTGYAGVNVARNEYVYREGSALTDSRAARTAATFYGQANVQLPHKLKLEASGFYQTAGLNGILRYQSFGSLNVGVQKSLFDERATLRLTVNDVLFSNRQRGSIRFQETDVRFLSYYESRLARLSFSYKLGNQQLKAARKRATSLEEERGRVKTDKE
ncbi:TonB-dependent receptor [Hymenobacter sp. BT175]|uniref:outer membrane beta-barrel protein n=1 Tax=Hymenobacter translucens TaxID=2886507 RepID=UPI001D0E66D4|nr:outer membrane beta-barrel protein [Hymenobacter translucens]MCC2545496.1 TonB-dependent receptor [Hymenobacter translucens]